MLRLSASWFFGIRHALVALAVLATLASAFGLHLHTGDAHEHDKQQSAAIDGHDHHDHLATKLTGELTDDDVGGLGTELDPDGCGSCHCQLSATDLPNIVVSLMMTDLIADLLMPRDQLLRDGITYQPDPPPVLG